MGVHSKHTAVKQVARKLLGLVLRGEKWGGAIEMTAAAELLTVDFAVYEWQQSQARYRRVSESHCSAEPRGLIVLLWSGGNQAINSSSALRVYQAWRFCLAQ